MLIWKAALCLDLQQCDWLKVRVYPKCTCRGYTNTSAVKSAISFIDGDKGILRYRGYPIEQLAERSNFTEVCLESLRGTAPRGSARLLTYRELG